MNLARFAQQFDEAFGGPWEEIGAFAHRDAASAAACSLEDDARHRMTFAVRIVQRDGRHVIERRPRR